MSRGLSRGRPQAASTRSRLADCVGKSNARWIGTSPSGALFKTSFPPFRSDRATRTEAPLTRAFPVSDASQKEASVRSSSKRLSNQRVETDGVGKPLTPTVRESLRQAAKRVEPSA
ncbi:hypothetical protein D3C72_1967090 [compost metagenome]